MTRAARLFALLCAVAILEPGARAETPEPAQEPAKVARLIPRETARRPSENGQLVAYAMRAQGLPRDKVYFLSAKWMDGSSRKVDDPLHLDESGAVLSKDGTAFELTLAGMFGGEAIVFTLASEDGSSNAAVEITPFPMGAVGEGGCRLVVKPMEGKGMAFQIAGRGFRPDHKIKGVSHSSGESINLDQKSDSDGSWSMIMFPAVVGKTGGQTDVTGSDGACSVTVRFSWGDQMRKTVGAPTAEPTPPPASPTPGTRP